MLTTSANLKKVQGYFSKVAKQIPFATSKALNDTAYTGRAAVVSEMKAVFDRPTPYALRGIVVDKSTKENLSAWVKISDKSASKGTPWIDILSPHFVGGNRVKKKSEHSLVRKGQFQGGKGFLGISEATETDAYGNLPRSKIVMLMSYFNAFKENGYKANKSDKQRAAMARGRRIVGPVQPSPYKKIGGVVYFMSRGKGWFVGQGKGWSGGRNQPLAAGIWAKTGIHGSDVKPVLLAIKSPTYRKRIDMRQIVGAVVDRDFKKNFDAAYKMAMRTAR